ncbi:helicase HerA-like domain-containing protein [Streptomyces sp. NPDC093261]|uniref:helicase HerA-like domain-containing protein n=1 Tax=Streptomyces sp. NPDC093261 TaxID=3366037 RepID=UPI00382FB4E4
MGDSRPVAGATAPGTPGSAPTLPRQALEIASGYAFAGPALDLGALVWDGRCLPDARIRVPLSVLNRHGLVAGATGTGKTRTLQLIAEQLSAQGVPVLLADVKGDLSGVSAPGQNDERVRSRAAETGQSWTPTAFPAAFYALGGLGRGMGPVDAETLERAVTSSPLYGRYAQAVDRESAYEMLAAREAAGRPVQDTAGGRRGAGREEPSLVEQVVASGAFRSLARSLGTQLGRGITRSLFGTARRRR